MCNLQLRSATTCGLVVVRNQKCQSGIRTRWRGWIRRGSLERVLPAQQRRNTRVPGILGREDVESGRPARHGRHKAEGVFVLRPRSLAIFTVAVLLGYPKNIADVKFGAY